LKATRRFKEESPAVCRGSGRGSDIVYPTDLYQYS
jgi:hypothetical protein